MKTGIILLPGTRAVSSEMKHNARCSRSCFPSRDDDYLFRDERYNPFYSARVSCELIRRSNLWNCTIAPREEVVGCERMEEVSKTSCLPLSACPPSALAQWGMLNPFRCRSAVLCGTACSADSGVAVVLGVPCSDTGGQADKIVVAPDLLCTPWEPSGSSRLLPFSCT